MAVKSVLAIFIVLCTVYGDIDPRHAINITIYHINQLQFPANNILNMDVADVYGDLYFDLRSRATPFECKVDPAAQDCNNPESSNVTDLAVTEVIVTVDSRFTNYSRCDVDNSTGQYTCVCYPGANCNTSVGREDVALAHKTMRPGKASFDWQWWRYNLAQLMGGFWYSMTDIGACPALHTDQPCTWRVAEVHKRVHKTCSDELINMAVYNHNQSCFNQCPQPHNSSTTCFSTCFYNTVLGPEFSSKSYDPSTTTMSKTVVGKAFQQAFADVSEGGCVEV